MQTIAFGSDVPVDQAVAQEVAEASLGGVGIELADNSAGLHIKVGGKDGEQRPDSLQVGREQIVTEGEGR